MDSRIKKSLEKTEKITSSKTNKVIKQNKLTLIKKTEVY